MGRGTILAKAKDRGKGLAKEKVGELIMVGILATLAWMLGGPIPTIIGIAVT